MSDSHRATVEMDGREVALRPDETVLDALERAGIDVASGCRSGTCKKCLLQADGDAPQAAQRGLRPQLVEQGYFLGCQARPAGGVLRIRDATGPEPVAARVEQSDRVSADVVRLFLRPERTFDFRPGQYVDVFHASGVQRSYSIASLPDDGLLELHVRHVPDGLVSGWLHGLDAGAELRVRGPFGQCFHLAGDSQRKILLAGAGTGLAPLLGIARDALDQGHAGPIDLVHGGVEPERLYLRDELESLAARWPQLRVHYCVLRNATPREHEGSLDDVVVRLASPLHASRAFLCGDAAIVQQLQRKLFLAGLPSEEIFADPFTPAAGAASGLAQAGAG